MIQWCADIGIDRVVCRAGKALNIHLACILEVSIQSENKHGKTTIGASKLNDWPWVSTQRKKMAPNINKPLHATSILSLLMFGHDQTSACHCSQDIQSSLCWCLDKACVVFYCSVLPSCVSFVHTVASVSDFLSLSYLLYFDIMLVSLLPVLWPVHCWMVLQSPYHHHHHAAKHRQS